MSTFAFLMITVDGFDEGPDQRFDFWTTDDEFAAFSADQLDRAGLLVFGRRTYEGMAAYWPTPAAHVDNLRLATRMNELPKVVVSRTLDHASWSNTRVVRDVDALRAVDATVPNDIAILGSACLTTSLLQAGFVDELRVMVNPIILGRGRSPFGAIPGPVPLRLTGTQVFDSGNVLLRYQPAAAS